MFVESDIAGLRRYLEPSAPLAAALARLDSNRSGDDSRDKQKNKRLMPRGKASRRKG